MPHVIHSLVTLQPLFGNLKAKLQNKNKSIPHGDPRVRTSYASFQSKHTLGKIVSTPLINRLIIQHYHVHNVCLVKSACIDRTNVSFSGKYISTKIKNLPCIQYRYGSSLLGKTRFYPNRILENLVKPNIYPKIRFLWRLFSNPQSWWHCTCTIYCAYSSGVF